MPALQHFVWCDLEFTDADVRRAHIMQAAIMITTSELEPIQPEGGEPGDGLSVIARLTPEQAATASPWVREHQAELLQRCLTDEAALPISEADSLFAAYVHARCDVPTQATDDPAERETLREGNPLLSGNSVHKDHALIIEHMPRLADALSFRLIDVSTLKELARRWATVPKLDKTDRAAMQAVLSPLGISLSEAGKHDALYDVKCSIAELAHYRDRWLRPPRAPS